MKLGDNGEAFFVEQSEEKKVGCVSWSDCDIQKHSSLKYLNQIIHSLLQAVLEF